MAKKLCGPEARRIAIAAFGEGIDPEEAFTSLKVHVRKAHIREARDRGAFALYCTGKYSLQAIAELFNLSNHASAYLMVQRCRAKRGDARAAKEMKLRAMRRSASYYAAKGHAIDLDVNPR